MLSEKKEEYYKLAEGYVSGKIEFEELMKECKTNFHISVVARSFTRFILLGQDEVKKERAKDGIKRLAENNGKIEYVAQEIVRRVIFSINNYEKKGKRWGKDGLGFLLGMLDRAPITEIGWDIKRKVNSYNENPRDQTNNYEEYIRKLNLPGTRIMRDYLLKRAKKEEEIRLLEEKAEPGQYIPKRSLTDKKETLSLNELNGYLGILAENAVIEEDMKIIELYAHFHEFVFYAIRNSSVDVCNKRKDEEYFFKIVNTLFENGSKRRVFRVLFRGLKKDGERKEELHTNAIKQLMEKDGDALIFHYEHITNPDMRTMVENFIMEFGSESMKKAIFDKKMPKPKEYAKAKGQREDQTFKKPGTLKRKT